MLCVHYWLHKGRESILDLHFISEQGMLTGRVYTTTWVRIMYLHWVYTCSQYPTLYSPTHFILCSVRFKCTLGSVYTVSFCTGSASILPVTLYRFMYYRIFWIFYRNLHSFHALLSHIISSLFRGIFFVLLFSLLWNSFLSLIISSVFRYPSIMELGFSL